MCDVVDDEIVGEVDAAAAVVDCGSRTATMCAPTVGVGDVDIVL
jgi:hypothetical protein